MADLIPLLSLPPLTSSDFNFDTDPFPIPPDRIQLEADTINVLEGRVLISTFSPEYQLKIKHFYQFVPMRQGSKNQNIAKRTRETMDLVGPE